ncbi:MAG TPA: hypothetical protein VHM22_18555 [Bradyrhizobium sp.]|nr:hypothetical protein [Bradyrhizobium sp.]
MIGLDTGLLCGFAERCHLIDTEAECLRAYLEFVAPLCRRLDHLKKSSDAADRKNAEHFLEMRKDIAGNIAHRSAERRRLILHCRQILA